MEEMNMRCPLPIDWLDFVETGAPQSLALHLEDCLSCQRLVASLRAEAGGDDLGDWLARIDLEKAVVWRPRPTESLGFGRLVLNAADYEGEDADYHEVPRLLFLVLDDGREIDGRRWFAVAPANTDVENASSTDLLLKAEETSLGVPLRILFSLQTFLDEGQMTEEVATLTRAGAEVVRQALAGELDDLRFGLPFAGPDDERLAIDRETEEVVRLLRTPFFSIVVADVAKQPEEEFSAVAAEPRQTGQLFFFDLNWLRVRGEQLALAAQTEPEEMVVRASLKTEWGEIEGQLHYELLPRDRLLFLIERLDGFESVMRLVLQTKTREEIESEPFVPRAGEEVEVASIFLTEVERLAARVG
jgi:hypothetical protein